MDSLLSDIAAIEPALTNLATVGANIAIVIISYKMLKLTEKRIMQEQIKIKQEQAKIRLEQNTIKNDVVQVSDSVKNANNKFIKIDRNLENLDKNFQSIIMGNPRVTIDSPVNGSRVPHVVPLHGTVEDLPSGMELWVMKEVQMGNYHPDDGPAIIAGKEWKSTAYVGNSTPGADTGISFKILIVEASHETGKKFKDYLKYAHQSGNWPGISTIYDGKKVATIEVIRDDS